MQRIEDAFIEMDALAEQIGGYFARPFEGNIEYTDLLFDVCRQFGIRYYSATPKERHFVKEVTRVTWANMQEEKTGSKQPAKDLSSIEIRKELNRAERKMSAGNQAHCGGRSEDMPFPGYAAGRTGS